MKKKKWYTNPFSQGRRAKRRPDIFRTQNERACVIKLVDEYSNNGFVHQHGRMNLTKHINVLSVLEKRALQYRKKVQVQLNTDEVLYNNAVDDTGTVSTESLINPDA